MLRPLISGVGEDLLRCDRGERRAQHDADQDLREAGRRRLSRQRQQDLDIDRAGCGQHPAADAHDGIRGLHEADRRHDDLLHEARSQEDRGASDSEDGSRCRGLECDLHRGLLHPGGGSDRRGGQGLLLPAAQPRIPERIIVAAGAIGIAQDALRRASAYAKERVVFGRPIGQNQSIQHPLAEIWCSIEAAWLMTMKAATLYDRKAALRFLRQRREAAGGACGLRCGHAGGADARRHGVREGIPGRAPVSASRSCSASRRSPSSSFSRSSPRRNSACRSPTERSPNRCPRLGIKSFAAYVPRLRMDRASIAAAHAWAMPSLRGLGKGERSFCSWDEDSITMSVDAVRACLRGLAGRADRLAELSPRPHRCSPTCRTRVSSRQRPGSAANLSTLDVRARCGPGRRR